MHRLREAPAWARQHLDMPADQAERVWRPLTTLVRFLTYAPGADMKMAGRQIQWLAGETFGDDPTRDAWRLAWFAAGHALEHAHGQATPEDFTYSTTGRTAPWAWW